MRILISTGIFKPDLGGPATLAYELAKRLKAVGHSVTVVTYSDRASYTADKDVQFRIVRVVRSKNKFSNYLRYFWALRPHLAVADVVYGLDWFSAGVPLMVAAKWAHKSYVVRIGGGYIWEKYLAEGKKPLTLKDFYRLGLHKNYKIMFMLIRAVLRNAERVVFNSDDQRILYEEMYGVSNEKTLTIHNAIGENTTQSLVKSYNAVGHTRDKEIVFAGRFIKMKNVESLVTAFSKLKDPSFKLLLIGDGPLRETLLHLSEKLGISDRVEFLPPMVQSELYRRIAHCYLVVIPSWTDVSPHQAYECLSLGIPFLLTKENYLSIRRELPLTIDPNSIDDIAEKMNALLEPSAYERFVLAERKIVFKHSWNDVLTEHVRMFAKLKKQKV